MINHRDIVRINGAIGKTIRDAVIKPGSQWGVTMYNAGLPPERKIEWIDEVSESSLSTAMFVQPFAWPGEILATVISGAAVVVSDSIQSGAGFFVTMHNAGLPENEKIKGEDKRHIARIIGPQAWPGIAFGIVAGGLEVIAYDSLRSGAGVFVYAYNFKLPDDQQIKCINDIAQDPRDPLRKYCPQAWPGIGFGVVATVVGITVADSVQSCANAFATAYNLGLPDNQKMTSVSELGNTSRPGFRAYGPQALPGIAVGLVAAMPSMALADSAKSGLSLFSTIINAGVSDPWKLHLATDIVNDPRHPLRKGGPQAWPGILVGGIGALACITVVDSACSGASTFVSLHNLGLDDSDQIKFIPGIVESDRNPWRTYCLQAWPGIAVGAGIGVLTVLVTDTIRSGSGVFASMYNVGLPDNQQIKRITEIQNDDRNLFLRKIAPQAWVGLAGGIVIGLPVAVFADSFKTAAGIFTTAYNYDLSEKHKITRMNEIQDDARHLARIIGPQAWLGIVAGVTSGVTIAALSDSVRSGASVFTTMYNYGLPEDWTMTPYENDSSGIRKYGPQAWIGSGFGIIAGLGAMTVMDSMWSTRSTFVSTFNLGLADHARITRWYNLRTDPRDLVRKIAPQAWLGVGAGFLAALPAMSLLDSFGSFFGVNASIYNVGLPKNQKITCLTQLQDDTRHVIRKIYPLAWPGLIPGIVTGGVIATIADSIKSGSRIFTSIYNFGLANEQKIGANGEYEIQNDERALYRIVGPQAWPGFVVGIPAGLLVASVADSIRSGTGVFASIYNAGMPEANKLTFLTEIQNDKREWFRMYLPQAWLGLAAGTVAGLAGGALADNIMSGRGVFNTMVNLVLDDADKITATPELANDERHWLRKYFLHAWPGIAIGGMMGGVSVCAIKSGRFTVDAFHSWQHLSGSIINVATERPYFEGLAQARPSDTDTFSQSMAKVVGYGLTVPTTGVAGGLIFIARKVPEALLLTTAIICSPITSVIKGIAALVDNQPRFPANLNTNQMIEDNFQNIFSSLDGMGRLPAGEDIHPGDGNENGWSVFRKCVTFNSKTPTEVTLDALLTAFRNYKGESFFTDKIFNDTVEVVKNEYRHDWLSSQFQIDSACQEVQDVVDFVLEYMGVAKVERNVISVPENFYTRRETNWNTLFFGTKPAVNQQVRQDQVDDKQVVADLSDKTRGFAI